MIPSSGTKGTTRALHTRLRRRCARRIDPTLAMRADQSLTGPVDVIRPRVAESEGPHDVVEDAAGLPRVMQRQDVWMGETRGGLDLPQEASAPMPSATSGRR